MKLPVKGILIACCALLFIKSFAQNNAANQNGAASIAIFDSIYYKVINNYVEEVLPQKLIRGAIDSMLASLDPFSSYSSAEEAAYFKILRDAKYGGIGCVLLQEGDDIVISAVYEGYPASKAGLLPGDTLLFADKQSLKHKTIDEARSVLMGKPGTSINVTVKHAGENTELVKTLTREEIKINAVPYSGMVGNDIGYIFLLVESDSSSYDVRRALLNLKTQHHLAGLIFDLRGNMGGYVKEARKIANLFLNKGDTLVSSRSVKKNEDTVYRATDEPVDADVPLIILTDQNTVSAGEIITGSLQDHDRGVVLGEKTFGKGLMQQLFDLPDSSQLKLTIAYYYTPSGRCIESANYPGTITANKESRVADSLKKVYKTTNGRIVFSYGGIIPDVQFAEPATAALTQSLMQNNLFFPFAIDYKLRHKMIPVAKDFHISDEEYKRFLDYLQNKKYDYETATDKKLKELQEFAQKENYPNEVDTTIIKLQRQIEEYKKDELTKYKQQIKARLEEEIAAVYYNNTGRYEYRLQNDAEIAKAIALLSDKTAYAKILMPGK